VRIVEVNCSSVIPGACPCESRGCQEQVYRTKSGVQFYIVRKIVRGGGIRNEEIFTVNNFNFSLFYVVR